MTVNLQVGPSICHGPGFQTSLISSGLIPVPPVYLSHLSVSYLCRSVRFPSVRAVEVMVIRARFREFIWDREKPGEAGHWRLYIYTYGPACRVWGRCYSPALFLRLMPDYLSYLDNLRSWRRSLSIQGLPIWRRDLSQFSIGMRHLSVVVSRHQGWLDEFYTCRALKDRKQPRRLGLGVPKAWFHLSLTRNSGLSIRGKVFLILSLPLKRREMVSNEARKQRHAYALRCPAAQFISTWSRSGPASQPISHH